MNQYRRKIVGVAKRVDEDFFLTHASSAKFSEKVRYKSEFTIRYGFRLDCGHVVDGQRGAGKKHINCYECEWAESHEYGENADYGNRYLEYNAIYIRGEWEDASEDEVRRIQAQS